MLKKCRKCGEEKLPTDFYLDKRRKDGLTPYCKPCHSSYKPNKEKHQEWHAKWYKETKQANPALFMWKQAKNRAKYLYNNLEFSIKVEDIVIPERCPYLDMLFIPLDREWGYSLDRIDSSKGYIPSNIRVISYKANRMKSNATEQELISFAKGVLAVHQGGPGPCS